MPTRMHNDRTISSVPLEFSGKWVAWNSDHTRIVASADSLSALWQIVRGEQIEDPVIEKVPRADVRFVGAR